MASETLEQLHLAATRRSHDRSLGWYERSQERWAAFRERAQSLTSKLPFTWHPVACDNPTQNHTGYTNGSNHIVLDEDFMSGRIKRRSGDALCRPVSTKWGVNLWGDAEWVSCKRCLEIAERLQQKA